MNAIMMNYRWICMLALGGILSACGAKEKQYQGLPEAELLTQGEALIKQSDCMTCHHKTNRILGPSHTEVATKYAFTEENITTLSNHIINGGAGVWGDIAMTPHADLSKEDAGKMVYYILSLDGEKFH